MCAPAPFFGVTDGVEKVTLRPFPVVWPALKWSTVRGFILTQADKFALRKYLPRLKLVFASDTGSYTLYFLPISLLLLFSPSHTQQGISVCNSVSLEFEKLNKGTVIFPIKWFAIVACCEAFEQRFNLWK